MFGILQEAQKLERAGKSWKELGKVFYILSLETLILIHPRI
jgi:hypothetical protein